MAHSTTSKRKSHDASITTTYDDDDVTVTIPPSSPERPPPTKDPALDIEGIKWPVGVTGRIRQDIIVLECRLGGTEHLDPKVAATKNIIAIFQGLVLLEDCLTEDVLVELMAADGITETESADAKQQETESTDLEQTEPGHAGEESAGTEATQAASATLKAKIWQTKTKILSSLQDALGYSRKNDSDASMIEIIKRRYIQARINCIRDTLRKGRKPADPRDPMTGLLIRLIDRAIVFGTLRQPFRASDDPRQGWSRVRERMGMVEKAVGDPGEEKKLHTEFASLVPAELRAGTSVRPWQIRQWVETHGGQAYQAGRGGRGGLPIRARGRGGGGGGGRGGGRAGDQASTGGGGGRESGKVGRESRTIRKARRGKLMKGAKTCHQGIGSEK